MNARGVSTDELIGLIKFQARAEMIARLLRNGGVPLDALTARLLRGMAEEIDKEIAKKSGVQTDVHTSLHGEV